MSSRSSTLPMPTHLKQVAVVQFLAEPTLHLPQYRESVFVFIFILLLHSRDLVVIFALNSSSSNFSVSVSL